MTYNIDFLIAAMIIQFLILWYFLGQKRADDFNNQIFLLLAILSSMDVITELFSTYYITAGSANYGYGAMLATTIFYVFQALLPLALLWYIQTLHNNSMILGRKRVLFSLPTMVVLTLILTNPFTKKLFYFGASGEYAKGPWYMIMYYSAIGHMVVALILVFLWRRDLGFQKVKIVLEILALSGCGVVIQLFYHPLLTTGFGLSLGILALFITINNPHANTDSLTEVYNHQYFTKKCDELLRTKKSIHVITVYLYQLKHVNRVTGIKGGDFVLQYMAGKLWEMCGKKVYRISGKRFLIMTSSLNEYENYLAGIKKIFDMEVKMDKDDIRVKMPVVLSGIINAERLESSSLIQEYSEYLETLAPEGGETEIIQDDEQTMKGFLYNKKVEQFLHTAIHEDLFQVYYQPVYSTQQERFITLEALSRLHHPELGWIAPDVFIQIAEKNHMIEQITDLQFHRICRFLNEHRKLMLQLLNVKVNLSSLDLMRNDCCQHFTSIMDKYEIPYNWIQFEITETVATEYSTRLRKIVSEFTEAGIRLCLDDFGSGYANFNTVTKLPFYAIKMDRSLLFDICTDEKKALFYQSIVTAFRGMEYNIISEGVETEEEMMKLKGWGVDMIQGYYFSRPLPPDDLLSLLQEE